MKDKRYDGLTDEQLAKQAQNGSLDAEEYLIRKYKEVVRTRSQLYFIMGADGEDVVQEGMIGLFKAIRSYDARRETSFHTFAETLYQPSDFNSDSPGKQEKALPA